MVALLWALPLHRLVWLVLALHTSILVVVLKLQNTSTVLLWVLPPLLCLPVSVVVSILRLLMLVPTLCHCR